MIRTILSIALFSAVIANAEPSPTAPARNKKSKKQTSTRTILTPKQVAVSPLVSGWSFVNGTWIHSDGYKYVRGQIVTTGIQTYKQPPKPPTKAEMDAATKKNNRPLTPAEIAAAKAAERERNLRPAAAPQTGTHL